MLAIIVTLLGCFLLVTLFSRLNMKGDGKVIQPLSSSKAFKAYTKAEVSQHNSRKDCWIVIKDKVYNVTPYVEEHPGGDAILRNAGGDATEGFYGASPSLSGHLKKFSANRGWLVPSMSC